MSVLAAARAGDAEAFAELVGPHRRELHAHCYRMLGRLDDADDLVQETLTAAWLGLPGFEERASLRTWLYRIATTRCLNAIRDRGRRPPPAPVPPFDVTESSGSFAPTWLQPYADHLLADLDPASRVVARASVEVAFVAALQRLPPRQTAALVLIDVLGFSVGEAADLLDTTATRVKGLLQRARAAAPLPAPRSGPGDDADARLAADFARAFADDDLDTVLALLTDDAWLAMPPAPQFYRGRDAVLGFLRAGATARTSRYDLVPTAAGGHAAYGCYLGGRARGLLVPIPSADGTRVAGIARFLDDALHARFGLPDHA